MVDKSSMAEREGELDDFDVMFSRAEDLNTYMPRSVIDEVNEEGSERE